MFSSTILSAINQTISLTFYHPKKPPHCNYRHISNHNPHNPNVKRQLFIIQLINSSLSNNDLPDPEPGCRSLRSQCTESSSQGHEYPHYCGKRPACLSKLLFIVILSDCFITRAEKTGSGQNRIISHLSGNHFFVIYSEVHFLPFLENVLLPSLTLIFTVGDIAHLLI